MTTSIKLTIFFDEPFWVGVVERVYNEKYEVGRIVFGSEPKDYEVYDFVLKDLYNIRYSFSLSNEETKEIKINPKRQQREIKRETKNKGIGTKAQLAMKLQYEAIKLESKRASKENKEEEKKKKFQLKQEKKKLKNRGH